MDEPTGAPGRPSVYTPETAQEILTRLSAGESLRGICRSPGMPPESTVRTWVLDDREGFAARYARARDVGLDVLADEVLDIADDGRNDRYLTEEGDYKTDHEAIQRSRLRFDARRWYLSKLAPKRYGDRVEHDIKSEGRLELNITHEIIDPAKPAEDDDG